MTEEIESVMRARRRFINYEKIMNEEHIPFEKRQIMIEVLTSDDTDRALNLFFSLSLYDRHRLSLIADRIERMEKEC